MAKRKKAPNVKRDKYADKATAAQVEREALNRRFEKLAKSQTTTEKVPRRRSSNDPTAEKLLNEIFGLDGPLYTLDKLDDQDQF